MPPEDERRLAAIMFTDVVGYTAITERDEARAVRIRETHRERSPRSSSSSTAS